MRHARYSQYTPADIHMLNVEGERPAHLVLIHRKKTLDALGTHKHKTLHALETRKVQRCSSST